MYPYGGPGRSAPATTGGGVEPRYGTVAAIWIGAQVGPLVLGFGALVLFLSTCEGTDESCDFGGWLVIFYSLLAVIALSVVLGPLALWGVLTKKGAPLAGSTAGWSVPFAVLSAVSSPLTLGTGFLWIPPLAGRWMALRRAGYG